MTPQWQPTSPNPPPLGADLPYPGMFDSNGEGGENLVRNILHNENSLSTH